VIYIQRTERLTRTGDTSGPARIETAGKAATLFALIAVIFAVLTFN
jgi:hypothetical protein